MKRIQRGFTLIELVMVIVILGVLAAIAIPKFIDMRGQANAAALAGVAGALSSAAAINYAARSAGAAGTVDFANCNMVAGALQGGLPARYVLNDLAIAAPVANQAIVPVPCTVTDNETQQVVNFEVSRN